MLSRTTDDYQNMYTAGIRACVEPAFWMGSNRRYAGTFFDYFQVILDWETDVEQDEILELSHKWITSKNFLTKRMEGLTRVGESSLTIEPMEENEDVEW
jgi:hypothetical protein